MRFDPSLYLVTDAGMVAARGRSLADVVREAVDGGVTAVQVREKDAPALLFLESVLVLAEVLAGAAPRDVALIVNDRVDVFLAARAAGARVSGVHVGQSDLPAASVRALVGPDAVVGVSASSAAELAAAGEVAGQVDYVGVGAFRATSTKPDAPAALGPDGFARLASATRLPAVAIGGIVPDDLAPLRAAGAAGVAVVSGICADPEPRRAARRYAEAWGVTA